MTLADFSNIATVVSSAAVLLSLIYLGLQTRQNSRHTRALIQLGRADAVMSDFATRSETPNATLLSRAYAGDETLNAIEVRQVVAMVMRTFVAMSESFHQQRDGLIDEARHVLFVNALRFECSNIGSRAVWRIQRNVFDVEFRKFVDEMIAQVGRPRPFDPVSMWRAAISAEKANAENAD